MSDALLPCVVVILIAIGGFHAVLESWWRRHHPPGPPAPFAHRSVRRAKDQLTATAEAIVADRYQLIADLYETPTRPAPQIHGVRADR